jgi:hypothetical protein
MEFGAGLRLVRECGAGLGLVSLSGFLLELLIFFCWTGPEFDSGGGRAGGVEGRCVGVGRRARVGDVVGEDA